MNPVLIISDHGTLKRLDTLAGQLKRPEALLKPVGREARNQLVKHFRAKDRSEANKLGGKRSHFWNQVASSVNQPQLNTAYGTIKVTVSDPRFAQKVFGGTIRPKRKRNLAIPVSKDAYGRTPGKDPVDGKGNFERETGLKLIFIKQNTNALLASVDPANDARLTVHYVLTPSVTQAPDPTALPPQAEFDRAILNRADRVLARLTGEANGGSPTPSES